MPLPPRVRVCIVGSGFAGLAMAIRLKQQGIDDLVVLERAAEVGGTWRDNTYPGCQCDVPSNLYSFSFAPNPGWSRTFSPGTEIQEYLRGCAERFGVLAHMRFGHELTGARWDGARRVWRLETGRGALEAAVLVAAVGGLSEPRRPPIAGLDSFEGTVFHSAAWRHDHDLDGERVAVIGTGASAIQFVPRIQPRVGRLHVFQRTPPWIMPHPDRATSALERRLFERMPASQRLVREAVYWGRESYVLGLRDPRRMRLVAALARRHLRRQVPDRRLRELLTPDYAMGCKRILISNDYYPSLTRDNVELVTSGIREIRPRSVVTADGAEREVDTLILGTGFHVADMPAAERIRGRRGTSLAELWQGSPRAHRGTTIAGFPNLFMLVGPNTGLGHTSIVVMIEAQVDHVLGALRHMEASGAAALEVRAEAQDASNRWVQEQMRGTVWTSGGCASWYLDRTGRNSTLWPSFTWRFRRATARFDAGEYETWAPAAEDGAVAV